MQLFYFKYFNLRSLILICMLVILIVSCKKEYRCNCEQDVAGIDTTFTLTGEGTNAGKACDQFDSEETEFGITKTVDCEPY